MKDNYKTLIERAIESKNRHPIEAAIAIDRSGTTHRDDYFSYKRIDADTLARRVHIYDLPGIVPVTKSMIPYAFERYSRGETKLFPEQITSYDMIGEIIPTITFETRFNVRTKEVTNFGVYKSKIKVVKTLTMMDIDMAYYNRDNEAPDENRMILKALEIDPLFEDMFYRSSAHRFGDEVIRRLINTTNASALCWADEREVPLIKSYYHEGQRLFFVSNEYISDTDLKTTNPIRNFPAFVNLSNISAHIIDRPLDYSEDDLNQFAAAATENEKSHKTERLYPEIEQAEVDSFVSLIIREEFAQAKLVLSETPYVGLKAINSIARNDGNYLKPLWDIAKVRDITIATLDAYGKPIPHTLTQVVIVRGHAEYKTPPKDIKTDHRGKACVEAALDFWKRYFNNPDFSKSYWTRQRDIRDIKDEHDANLNATKKDDASSNHLRVNNSGKAGNSHRKTGRE